MYYPEELISEVRQRNDIVDVISQYVGLKKKGNNYTCCCPFHSEKTPSFSVSRTKQMYKCFGCGEGGNVYTFLQKYENMSFPEAVKALADRAGIELPQAQESEETKKKEYKRQRLLQINKDAAAYYYVCLRDKRGQVGTEYFKNRKLTEETKNRFGLGYASVNGKEVIAYLKGKGYSDSELIDSGLATFSEKYGMSSKFWNRVMFPIQDINGRVIGFGGRVLGQGEPKYLNSPETEIFDKSRNLYGLNFAKTSRKDYLILCEGYMDVIALHQAGFTEAVASLGTAFTQGQAHLIKRYVKTVYLSYDSDGAGVKAALRAIEILRNFDLSVKVIDMKPYKDPDEFIKNLGAGEYEERIKNAENAFLFQVRIKEGNYDLSDPDGKTRFFKEVAALLCEFSEDLERENYIQAISLKYGVKEENLRGMVGKSAMLQTNHTIAPRPVEISQARKKKEEAKFRDEELLLTSLADSPGLYSQIKKYISANDFLDETYHYVAEKFFGQLDAGIIPEPAALISMVDDADEQSRISSLFNTYLEQINTKEEKEKAFKDIVLSVKRKSNQFYSMKSGTDMNAINEVIAGKKALQELEKIRIIMNE